ncbi:CAMKK protein kinase, variant 2 [Aphanomyces astaci]|uniref:CAMKK protein kinase, variant 2 n=1 Tax=Aphanomyces astaci TaxID=112090 RepID=W4GWD6_APHAT|nr:CAMKK protein kinase, variant 2 [Aphanomyces astaci]ETV83218.1 CAMKK protein kinase, variant 2 [Aphanomyces astaci]|eukprot:XP_009826647.1 CAMKK protein kinase, variant 2 [Aphanomyces astaci]
MATADEEVKQTDVAQVEENDDGVPSQVNEYKVGSFLGEGAFSKVYLCHTTVDFLRTNYALKILNKSFLKRKREIKMVDGRPVHSNAFHKVVKEVAIMKKLRHPNLTKLHEVIDDAEHDKMYLVLELVTGGQVMDWDQQAMVYKYLGEDKPAPVSVVQTCVLDIALALEYLHANQICHRDIKPENVLRSNDHYKLSDFGVAHMFADDDANELKNTEGTYHYLAPECTVGKAYDPFKVDVWALGVTAYAMLFRRLPFAHSREKMTGGALAIMQCIREDALEIPTPDVDDDCLDVLRRLMDKDPETRITLAELKNHPWLQRAKQALLEQDEESAALAMRLSVVSISESDIDLAFTPVNNLMLMVYSVVVVDHCHVYIYILFFFYPKFGLFGADSLPNLYRSILCTD